MFVTKGDVDVVPPHTIISVPVQTAAKKRRLSGTPTRDVACVHAPELQTAAAIVEKEPLQAAVLNPRFYFWFGVALDQAKQTDRAVAMFETCLENDPEFADALNYLAYLWAVRGERLYEALRHAQAALALDPENAAYLDTLGWVYYQQGRYADALKFLQQADALRPGDAEILGHVEKAKEKLAPPAP